jgi:cation:H+ antiporter
MIPSGLEYISIPIFVLGVLLLYKGSDILVDGTVKIATRIGISSLIISVLLVGFGTSAPEFAISVGAAYSRNSGISLGNIIGSCIANLLLVLGVSAIIRPIKIKKSIIKREFPITFAATFILLFATIFYLLDEWHILGGLLFVIFFIGFIWFFIRCAHNERIKESYKSRRIKKNLFLIFLGICGVVAGAWMLIESSITIANFLGVPQFIIAMSMVAVGTSLPELVVSAVASFKNESDIAIGNVLGSNVFNILLILGVSALFIPLNARQSLHHLIILLGVTFLMLPIFFSNKVVSRREGLFMLVIYSIFIWYIFFF